MSSHTLGHYSESKKHHIKLHSKTAVFLAGLIIILAVVAGYLSFKKNLVKNETTSVTSSWNQYLQNQSRENVDALKNFKTALQNFSKNLAEAVRPPAPEVQAARPLPKPPVKFGTGLIIK